MQKKIFSFILIFLCFSFCACKKDIEKEDLSKYNPSTIEVFKENTFLGSKSEVIIGDYKNLTFNISKPTVREEDVQNELEYRISSKKYYTKIFEGIVEEWDTINISFVGTIDGVAFDGGSADFIEITIGEGAFIDGFEDGLIGKSIGDEVVVKSIFPEDYGVEDLNGKEAEFKVKINYLCGTEVSYEITDDFIKEYTIYNSIKEYKNVIRKELEEYYSQDYIENKDDYYYANVRDTLIDISEVKQLNKIDVYDYYEGLLDYYKNYSSSIGYAMETFCKTFFNMTQDEFYKELATISLDSVSFESIIKELANKENIIVSDEDYDSYLNEIVEEYGYSSKNELINEIESSNGVDSVKLEILTKKVIDYIISINKVIEE